MKFMLIVHHDEEAFSKIEKEKRQQMLAESVESDAPASRHWTICPRVAAAASGNGGHGAGARRQTACDRRPLHRNPRADCRLFSDHARDLNEAVAIAGRIPGARIGTVEVRPLIEITGLPKLNSAED